MDQRQNVIWIMTDQHARFATGCYGSAVAHTPRIDGLAREGIRFDCAFTPSPVCVPARDATLSGQYPHTLGYGCDGNFFPSTAFRTGAHAFRENGYTTAFIGKLHPVIPYTRGFDYYVDLGHYYDYLGPELKRFILAHQAQDSGSGCPWMSPYWYEPHAWTETGPAHVNGGIKAYSAVLDAPDLLPEEDQFEAFVVRNAKAFLDRHETDPFFLCVNFVKPHFPYASPQRHHDRFRPEDMQLPDNAGAWASTPECNRRWVQQDLTDSELRRKAQQLMADYYAAVSHADECVGQILDELQRRGIADDTIVVYTTDHGEMLFNHGLLHKFVFYDQSARIPLIIRAPRVGTPGTATTALTDLTDLLPTCLSLAGCSSDDTFDGVDLSPVIRGDCEQVRDACFSMVGPRAMIRTEQWKLCHYPEDDWHLFDCVADPDEDTNLHDRMRDDPAITALRTTLLRWQGQGVG
ncbi:MAG: sulfatase-like hydrolase/transferase [Lentisphaerae bacterium]|jgi:arylsulfatase A-like enzyme|nr:sulfatase-like hydrolase/transferase [Lentisphaerota bacterium]MBT4819061.1 sulfatase-like hydrolase/transferase [Lentisphaerota bacterium]MBT5608337.1 sulfatase-like hydrolase/transferase [Lentisphaerota bacterium]MBT7057468.1 sulfatase-like hydrolase/transferase [Lentisphaerota bacterium]MBT7844494.1 sulfatase-like hydrolase/transferase [Lentisphaerota bacterium]